MKLKLSDVNDFTNYSTLKSYQIQKSTQDQQLMPALKNFDANFFKTDGWLDSSISGFATMNPKFGTQHLGRKVALSIHEKQIQ